MREMDKYGVTITYTNHEGKMRPINLSALDLNLLVVFAALYEERHVSRAGQKIGLSQPSTSQALKRLREVFEDELFVRGPDGMAPTARALELSQHILPALAQLRSVIREGAGFDPATSERHFVIGLNDLGSFALLPLIIPSLRTLAPAVTLTVRNVGARDSIEKLETGEIEFVCGVFDDLPAGFDSAKLSSLGFSCLSDRRNPRLVGRPLDLQVFLELPHVQIAVNADPGIAIDLELATLSLRRRVAVVVPHFMAVPGAVLGTDMIGVFPSQGLHVFRNWRELRVDPLPLELPGIAASAVWHRRSTGDPGHRWFRSLVIAKLMGGPDINSPALTP